MDLQHLRVFRAVALTGSFSAAARALARSQPAVTLAVQELERRLGRSLFDRSGKRAALSEAGRRLLAEADALLAAWEALPGRLTAPAAPSGRFRLGLGEGSARFVAPPLVEAARRLDPPLEVIVGVDSPEACAEALRRGSLDGVLRTMSALPAGCRLIAERRWPYLLVSAKREAAGALTWDRIRGAKWVAPPPGSEARRRWEALFTRHAARPNVTAEPGGWDAVKRYVSLGIGWSVLSAAHWEKGDEQRLSHRDAPSLFGRDRIALLVAENAPPAAARRLAALWATRGVA